MRICVPGATSSNAGKAKSIENTSLATLHHQVFQSYETFPERHIVAQKVEKRDLAKALEGIPAWAQEYGELNAISKRSDTAFKSQKRVHDLHDRHAKAVTSSTV